MLQVTSYLVNDAWLKWPAALLILYLVKRWYDGLSGRWSAFAAEREKIPAALCALEKMLGDVSSLPSLEHVVTQQFAQLENAFYVLNHRRAVARLELFREQLIVAARDTFREMEKFPVADELVARFKNKDVLPLVVFRHICSLGYRDWSDDLLAMKPDLLTLLFGRLRRDLPALFRRRAVPKGASVVRRAM